MAATFPRAQRPDPKLAHDVGIFSFGERDTKQDIDSYGIPQAAKADPIFTHWWANDPFGLRRQTVLGRAV